MRIPVRDKTPEPCVALVPIFSHLSPEQQREVAEFARPKRFDKGEMLMRAGQRQAQLFVVHAGRVKISRTSLDGRETILRILEPGDVGGEEWFLTGASPVNDGFALEATRACVFDHAELVDLIQRYPDIGVAALGSLAERLADAERMLAARTLVDVGARIAAYLLDRPPTRRADGTITVRLPMAKKDVATFLGTTPETFSRRLGGLEQDGLIRVRGRDVDLLDVAALDERSHAS